jgi:hypothetical protein
MLAGVFHVEHFCTPLRSISAFSPLSLRQRSRQRSLQVGRDPETWWYYRHAGAEVISPVVSRVSGVGVLAESSSITVGRDGNVRTIPE